MEIKYWIIIGIYIVVVILNIILNKITYKKDISDVIHPVIWICPVLNILSLILLLFSLLDFICPKISITIFHVEYWENKWSE